MSYLWIYRQVATFGGVLYKKVRVESVFGNQEKR